MKPDKICLNMNLDMIFLIFKYHFRLEVRKLRHPYSLFPCMPLFQV